MKKKVRNNKVILASILALGCLTAASVGFSSWVIAAQNIITKSNVIVNVDGVEDHRYKFDVTASSSDSTIRLGPKPNGKYISPSGSVSEEDLNFNFELTFTAKGSSAAFDFTSLGDQSLDIKFSFANTLNINDGEEYIKFPSGTIGTISKSGFTAGSGITTATQSSNVITYSGKLDWGSYFGGKNPSELDDSTKVDLYIAKLNYLRNTLDNQKLEITVNIEKSSLKQS